MRKQVFRHRDVLDFDITAGVVERNLVAIVENCDRAFELTEEGFDQPIPQHKLRKIQRDALVALSDWVEPAAQEYERRMDHAAAQVVAVLGTEGGRESYGAKQWNPAMQHDVSTQDTYMYMYILPSHLQVVCVRVEASTTQIQPQAHASNTRPSQHHRLRSGSRSDLDLPVTLGLYIDRQRRGRHGRRPFHTCARPAHTSQGERLGRPRERILMGSDG